MSMQEGPLMFKMNLLVVDTCTIYPQGNKFVSRVLSVKCVHFFVYL